MGNPNFVEKGFTLPELLTRHLSLAALVPGAKNTAEGKQDQTTIWRGQDRQGAGRMMTDGSECSKDGKRPAECRKVAPWPSLARQSRIPPQGAWEPRSECQK